MPHSYRLKHVESQYLPRVSGRLAAHLCLAAPAEADLELFHAAWLDGLEQSQTVVPHLDKGLAVTSRWAAMRPHLCEVFPQELIGGTLMREQLFAVTIPDDQSLGRTIGEQNAVGQRGLGQARLG